MQRRTSARNWIGLLAGAVGLLLGGCLAVRPSQAQSAFCPTSIPGLTGFAFSINECTNGLTGAYSNTTLATQALSDLSQSSTQDVTKATMASVSERRAREEERCPDGFTRVAGICRPASTASRFAPESAPDGVWGAMPAEMLAFAQPRQAFNVLPQIDPAARFGVWTQAYGDYERRTGRAAGTGEFSVLAIDAKSTTWSGGVLGGFDVTSRNVTSSGDGLIVGVLAGYMSSHSTINTSTNSSNPASVPSGFSTVKARLAGPVTGLYASYFNGGFSTDLAFKVELLELNISFDELLGFGANPGAGIPAQSVAFSGSASTQLNNYTTSGNVNYRIPAGRGIWIEPTAGFQYTVSDYASDAAALGLANGSLLRLQAGTRLGVESFWDTFRITTVLTGLVYNNVSITGGVVQHGPGSNPLILSDEGRLRGQGILALNVHYGNGVSSFVQADVQGGEDLFGAGGKTGVRFVW